MAVSEEFPVNPKMTVADIAYRILKLKGEPVYFRDLISEVLSIKPVHGVDLGHQMASVHTELNLDNRFVFLGGGMWSLREINAPARQKEYEEDWEG